MKRSCKPGHKRRMKAWSQKVRKVIKILKKINKEREEKS